MLRLHASLLVALLVASVQAEENDAEKLYRAAQTKVRDAKTLRVHIKIDVTDATGRKGVVEAALLLGDGDKYRVEGKGTLFGETVHFVEVSDGTATSYVDKADPKRNASEKTAAGAGAKLRGSFTTVGFLLKSLTLREKTDVKTKGSDFASGPDEKGSRVVTFKFSAGESADPLSVKLFIDAKSGLPSKLSVTGLKSDIRAVTETYQEFVIGKELDAKLFEVPKQER